jgi:hypothetical protein
MLAERIRRPLISKCVQRATVAAVTAVVALKLAGDVKGKIIY